MGRVLVDLQRLNEEKTAFARNTTETNKDEVIPILVGFILLNYMGGHTVGQL